MSIRIKFDIMGKQQKEVIFSNEKEILIGRPKQDTVPTIDFTPDNRVSRPHFIIYNKYGTWWINDIQSKNGTFVNVKYFSPHWGKEIYPSQ
jgi:pSer/pThr/pTyr-binding forkhead associated (FHA) protein